jgi:hypothetical protein
MERNCMDGGGLDLLGFEVILVQMAERQAGKIDDDTIRTIPYGMITWLALAWEEGKMTLR